MSKRNFYFETEGVHLWRGKFASRMHLSNCFAWPVCTHNRETLNWLKAEFVVSSIVSGGCGWDYYTCVRTLCACQIYSQHVELELMLFPTPSGTDSCTKEGWNCAANWRCFAGKITTVRQACVYWDGKDFAWRHWRSPGNFSRVFEIATGGVRVLRTLSSLFQKRNHMILSSPLLKMFADSCI